VLISMLITHDMVPYKNDFNRELITHDTMQKMILIVNYTRIQFDTYLDMVAYHTLIKKHNINRQVIEVYHTNKNINNT
jgi:hypothetical protein